MCVVLIVSCQEGPWRQKHAQYLDGPEQSQSQWCENTPHTEHHTHQCSLSLQASMLVLPNGEKEASTMCVVLVGCQEEGSWRQQRAQYLDGPEQSQSWWCGYIHRTERLTH